MKGLQNLLKIFPKNSNKSVKRKLTDTYLSLNSKDKNMLYYKELSKSKLYCIIYLILSLIIFNGCGHKEPALEHKEQKPDDLKKAIESPLTLLVIANIYYAQMGKWPDSIDDLEKIKDNPFSDIDWSRLKGNIVFEKLPEGGLKITSIKGNSSVSVSIPKPLQFEKGITP
jgi:hypothetical protein